MSSRSIVNALTVDVEEYFHPNVMDDVLSPEQWGSMPPRVERNTYRLLDLLDEHRQHATFFVLGWVAERWPDMIREIARRGHEIACHGYAHRLAYRLGPEEFRADVRRARSILEDCFGAPPVGFRAASYSIVSSTLWALDILIELGFRYDSSIFPVRHDIYGIPGFARFPVVVRRPAGEILEIPASTVRWSGQNWPMAGGGYLRLLPYGFTRWAVRRVNERDGQPAIVYVHPWECDVDQPRLPAPRLTSLRQYANLHRTEPRLRRLLREFRFAPIPQAFASAWDAARARGSA